jgi:hypothetical protein
MIPQDHTTTWYSAQAACESLGYNFVIIETAEEEAFITSNANELV